MCADSGGGGVGGGCYLEEVGEKGGQWSSLQGKKARSAIFNSWDATWPMLDLQAIRTSPNVLSLLCSGSLGAECHMITSTGRTAVLQPT